MSTPPLPPLSTADHAKLADQMTDEILRQLLSTEITVPNRMLSADNTTHQLHLFHQEPVADVFVIDA